MIRIILSGFLILAILGLVIKGLLYLFILSVPVQKEPSITTVDLNKRIYDSIHTSMTLTQVEAIVGSKPSQVVEEGDKFQLPGYYWRDSDGDEIRVYAPKGLVEVVDGSGDEVVYGEKN